MDTNQLIQQAQRILQHGTRGEGPGALIEALEFLRVYAGEKSSFYKALTKVDQTWSSEYIMQFVSNALQSFVSFVQNGLLEGISIERKAQIDVVSDFLEQANELLNSKDMHPAASTVLIGASLEEFLRNWVEDAGLDLGGKKPSIDSYAKVLRESDLITKQDAKDITSWSGLRNHAAHGEWEQVADKQRIALMLEGVNLFMRKYGEHGT